LKRSIIGSYHKVSIKHLDAYLDELEHRFNNRKNEYIFRDTLTKLVTAAALPYRELVKAAGRLVLRSVAYCHPLLADRTRCLYPLSRQIQIYNGAIFHWIRWQHLTGNWGLPGSSCS